MLRAGYRRTHSTSKGREREEGDWETRYGMALWGAHSCSYFSLSPTIVATFALSWGAPDDFRLDLSLHIRHLAITACTLRRRRPDSSPHMFVMMKSRMLSEKRASCT